MGVKCHHVAGRIEAVIGVVDVALIVVSPVAVIGIERDQIVRRPIGEFVPIGHAADNRGRSRADGDGVGRRRHVGIVGHPRIRPVDEFLQVGKAIVIGVAARAVIGVGDDLAGVQVVITDHTVIEWIQAILHFPTIRQTVPGRACAARIGLEPDDVEFIASDVAAGTKDIIELGLVESSRSVSQPIRRLHERGAEVGVLERGRL